jgi:Ca2+-binding RTX toxin-like protein
MLSRLFKKKQKPAPRFRPRLEALEDRSTPAILFTPQDGTPTVTDGGGPVIQDAPIFLIYWGRQWGSPTTSPSRAAIDAATASLFSSAGSPYQGHLRQYDSVLGRAHFVRSVWDNSPVPNGFSEDTLVDVVQHAYNHLGLPDPDDLDPSPVEPLYLVVTPPGINSDDAGAGGYHNWGDFHDEWFDWDRVYYGWIGNTGTLDSVTTVLSHEVIEAITDPEVPSGITATTGGDGELSDGEGQNYAFRLNGVLAQSYWSAAAGAYAVPTGQRQNFWVDDGVLTVNGDQRLFDSTSLADNIIIDRSGSRVRVTLNGETAQFEPDQISAIVVNAGAGGDTVVVEGTVSGVPLTVNLGSEVDIVRVCQTSQSLSNLGADVTINGDGSDQVFVHDQRNPVRDTFTITDSSVGRTRAGTIHYSGLGYLGVNGGTGTFGTGTLTYNVRSTRAGTPLALTTGSGASTINVGGGNLDNLRANVSVDGQPDSGADRLYVDDRGNPRRDAVTVTDDSVTRTGAATIRYVNLDGVTISGGSGSTGLGTLTYNVDAAGAPLTINAGSGDSVINFGRGNLDVLPGTVTVNGEGGSDALNINDQVTPHSDSYGITATQVRRSNPLRAAAGRTVNLSGIDRLSLNAEGGNNAITLGGASPIPVAVNAGWGSDTLVGPNLTSLWTVTGPNSGTLGNVTFSAAERLVGGSSDDIFRLGPDGILSGPINGGAGTNWLDYSLLPAARAASVNLATGSASGVYYGAAGGLGSIRNVRGGAGGDTLRGDGFNNILVGGEGADQLYGSAGRDLLIGAGGADVLVGGLGEDILIGGVTHFDNDNLVLPTLMREWTRADLPYESRIGHLLGTTAGGLNGSFYLSPVTVHDESAPGLDHLKGERGARDWFWAFGADSPDDLVRGVEWVNAARSA